MSTKIITNSELNPNQESFCKYYISEEFFCNWVKSYMKAYPNSEYNTAKVEASKYLTNPNILARINELLDASWLNDEFVDKQLLKLLTQEIDFTNKLWAIKEYNKLKQRIVDKSEVDNTVVDVTEDLSEDQRKKIANRYIKP